MSEHTPIPTPEEQGSAFIRILNATSLLPAQITRVAFILGTYALIAANVDPATLPPTFAVLSGVGAGLVSDLIVRVARGRADDEEIRRVVQEAVANTNVDILDRWEFRQGLSQILRQHRHLGLYLQNAQESVLDRLEDVWDGIAIIRQQNEILLSGMAELQAGMQLLLMNMPQNVVTSSEFSVVDQIPAERFTELASELARDIENRYQEMRQAALEGRYEEALTWVRQLRNSAAFRDESVLLAEDKANYLRFEASLELNLGRDLELARSLANRARDLAPTASDFRLNALILRIEQGLEAALSSLEGLTDVENQNLRARLLLESGRIQESLLVIESVVEGANADTFQIRGLAHLCAHDLAQAQQNIDVALGLASRAKHIRYAAAVIDYFNAIAEPALPDVLLAWPDPIRWEFVRENAESRQSLERAAQSFEEIAALANEEERERMEAWRLACLANIRERQQEAIEYCRELILRAPHHIAAIRWSILRSYDIDLSASERVLTQRIDTESATLADVDTLLKIYYLSNRDREVLNLIERVRPLFQQREELEWWAGLHIHALAVLGEYDAALTSLDQQPLTSEMRRTRASVLSLRAISEGVWEPLFEYLENCYDETGDAGYLFELCEFRAHRNEWQYVAEQAQRLIEEVGTGSAITLAALAAYNIGDFSQCLVITEDGRHRFEGNRLPRLLRQLRISCHRALGIVSEALEEAQALAREEPSTVNLLNLAHLYLEIGDFSNYGVICRQLNRRSDLQAEDALRLAIAARLVDTRLAQLLWERSVASGLPDEAISAALLLGYQLGQDETRTLEILQRRMLQLAAEGRAGISGTNFSQFADWIRQRREHQLELLELYRDGRAPIHLIQEYWDSTLLDIYHRIPLLRERSPNPREQDGLYFHHGSRLYSPQFPENSPGWRLHLDITAVLLAEHLGILDQVEEQFNPLHIPASLIPALVQLLDGLQPTQPRRIALNEQVISLVERGRLILRAQPHYPRISEDGSMHEDWNSFLHQTAADEFLVCFESHRQELSSFLSEDFQGQIINLRSVVESLHRFGPLSAQAYSQALEALGTEGHAETAEQLPQSGAALICIGNIPVEFARIGVLETLSNHFRHIYISDDEPERLRGELEMLRSSQELGEWLSQLIERLRTGIEEHRYERLPMLSDEASRIGDRPLGQEEECFFTLIRLPFQENAVIWIDDRNATSYRTSQFGNPIISIVDVLKALVNQSLAEQNDYPERLRSYYRSLHRLRAANVCVIPLQADEIVYNLQQAHTDDTGILVETSELRVLRQYVASCLLNSEHLNRPGSQGIGASEGEINFVVGLRQAISSALAMVWRDADLPSDTLTARANWILENLYLDLPALFELTPFEPAIQDNLYLTGAGLGALVSNAIDLEPIRISEEETAATRYLEWLSLNVLHPRLDAEPNLVVPIANTLKDLVRAVLSDVPQEEERQRFRIAILVLLQRFFRDLPEPIREELLRDVEFVESLGITPGPFIEVGELRFRPDLFWAAAASAVNGTETRVERLDEDSTVIFRPSQVSSDPPAFTIETEDAVQTIVQNRDFNFLLENSHVWETELRHRRSRLDLTQLAFEELVAQVLSTSDAGERVLLVRRVEESSAFLFYERLHNRLRETGQLDFGTLIPPDSDGLLRHIRIDSHNSEETDFRNILESSAEDLLANNGIQVAIERLAPIPTPLPDRVIHAFAELTVDAKRELIKRLLRIAASPVTRIQFCRLLLAADEIPAFRRLGRRAWRFLLSDAGRNEYQAFNTVLDWTNEQFGRWPDFRANSSRLRLMMLWLHAHRLFTILVVNQAPLNFIHGTFDVHARMRLPYEAFERETAYWHDVAHPRQLYWALLLLCGISYAADEEFAAELQQDLRNAIIPEITRDLGNEVVLVTVPVIRDSSSLPNSLGSFLSNDLGEVLSQLLGQDNTPTFSFSTFAETTRELISSLAAMQNDIRVWWHLWLALRSPFPTDLAERLNSALMEISFTDLYRQDRNLGALALQVSSQHIARNVTDEVFRRHLEQQLVGLASYQAEVSASQRETIPEDFVLSLLDVALNISRGSTVTQTIESFAPLVESLLNIVGTTPSRYRPVIDRLCRELPVDQARAFWRLLISLRAS